MNDQELQARLTAWAWAAQTLGVEASVDRIRGLVEVTSKVRIENLKPALEAVIKSEPEGFLPSPGAVIAAANRIAEREVLHRLGTPREMSSAEHRAWMRENNPDGWDKDTWTAFLYRMASDRGFQDRAKQANEHRHAWAAQEFTREIAGRSVSHVFRVELRRRLNNEAFDVYPRPNPFDDGWSMPAGARVGVGDLAERMRA